MEVSFSAVKVRSTTETSGVGTPGKCDYLSLSFYVYIYLFICIYIYVCVRVFPATVVRYYNVAKLAVHQKLRISVIPANLEDVSREGHRESETKVVHLRFGLLPAAPLWSNHPMMKLVITCRSG